MSGCLQSRDNAEAVKCTLAAESLRSSGRLRLRVTGWSMFPAIHPGDTLDIQGVAAGDVAQGDVVLFERDGRLFVHRVLDADTKESKVLTRGDAMPQADPPLESGALLGKVIAISRRRKAIAVRRDVLFRNRAVSALIRSSEVAARVVVGMHGIVYGSNIPEHRDAPCRD